MFVAKKKVGIWMDSEVASELDDLAERFDGLKGELVSAAVRMFLAADPDAQRHALKEVMGAKVDRLFANGEAKDGRKLRLAASRKKKD